MQITCVGETTVQPVAGMSGVPGRVILEVAPDTKFVPVIERVTGHPRLPFDTFMLLTVGAGMAGRTEKPFASDAEDPSAGFVTTTFHCPGAADGGMEMLHVIFPVDITEMLDAGISLLPVRVSLTPTPAVKPDPATWARGRVDPAHQEAGEMEVTERAPGPVSALLQRAMRICDRGSTSLTAIPDTGILSASGSPTSPGFRVIQKFPPLSWKM